MATSEFRLDLGATWLNLLSTVSGRFRDQQHDAIGSPGQLGRFLDAVGLPPRRAPDATDLAAAHRLREDLYAIARATVDGGPVPRSALAGLNTVLATDVAAPVSPGPGGIRAARPTDATEALGRIARQAADQLTSPERPRLRACGDDTCASIFLDATGRRRWCNDALCGSRVRVRAHRARHLHGAAPD